MKASKKATTKRVNGDGSVYFRASDKRWCATLSLASPAGKPRRVTRTVPATGTKTQQIAAAEAKLVELIRMRNNDGDIQTSALTVGTWARKWLEDISGKEVRPKTTASYRTTITQYIIPSIGRVQLKKLAPEDVRVMLKFVTDKGLSSRSAALTYQVLSLILDAAFREGKVTRNVAKVVNRPRTKKAELTILTAAHGIKVLETVASDRLGSRWAAALFTGARQGEVIGLEWDRVDFLNETIDMSWQLQRLSWEHGCGETGELTDEGKPVHACGRKRGAECRKRKLTAPEDWEHRHVQGGLWLSRPKSKAGWRIITLVEPLLSILERRRAASILEPNPFGFVWTQPSGAPLDPSPDNREWHAVLERAGAPDARLHDARHTTVDLLYEAGVAEALIQEIVGHSVVSVTRGYRSRGNQAQMAKALTQMSALLPLEAPPVRG